MGKYSSVRRQQKPRDRGVHPLMRGIGCIMIFVVPVFAYGSSILAVDFALKQGWPIPAEWFGPPTIHPLLMKLQGLQPTLYWLQGQINLEAYLFFTVVITAIVGVFMILLYGYIYTVFGPSRYGPLDEPPTRKKFKPYKR